jgi:hypothetical protein
MIWYLSAWNRNEGETEFKRFWRWNVYVTDEEGDSYQCSNRGELDNVGPRPGERLRFRLIFPPVTAGVHNLTLHAQADVRTCIWGLCDIPISWENETVTIPTD